MGSITIKVEGSFTTRGEHKVSALAGGHAAAIGRAIEHLAAMLPMAIVRDHELHDEGQVPPDAPYGLRERDIESIPDGHCIHGKGMTDYCEPCGRVSGGG